MVNCEYSQLTLDAQLIGVLSGENSMLTRFTDAHTHTHTHTKTTETTKTQNTETYTE